MKICKQCVLPETYSGIEFNSKGVCNICKESIKEEDKKEQVLFEKEEELIKDLLLELNE